MINVPIIPDWLFWKWAIKSICKGAYFGLAVGLIWTLFTLYSFEGGLSSRIMFVFSSATDTVFVFTIVSVAFLIGLVQNSWDNIFVIFRKGRQKYTSRALWAVLIPMTFAVLANIMMTKYGLKDNTLAYLGVNYTISAMLAMTASYNVFVTKAVLTREEIGELASIEESSNLVVRTFRKMPIFDRTKMNFSMILGLLLPAAGLSAAMVIVNRIDQNWAMALIFSMVLSVTFVLLGVFMRIVDMIKPFGLQEKLVPSYELHLAKGPRAELAPE